MAHLRNVFTVREGKVSKEDGVCDVCCNPDSQPTFDFDVNSPKVKSIEVCMKCLTGLSELHHEAKIQLTGHDGA